MGIGSLERSRLGRDPFEANRVQKSLLTNEIRYGILYGTG